MRTHAVLAIVCLGVVLMFGTLLRAVTDAMLFHPEKGQTHTPSDFGAAFEDLRLVGADGVRTQAWWIPAPSSAGVTVVFFHGNAGTIADRLPRFLELRGVGVSVLAAEYRGYGDSEGAPSEDGLVGDACVAVAEAKRRADARGDRLFVGGRSLGGAVAIQAAARASAGVVSGLWVESTFRDLPSMAARSGVPAGRHLVAYSFDSLGTIANVDAPILVTHGDRDALIPLDHGRALAEAARAAGRDAEFVVLPGADHNASPAAATVMHRAKLHAFLGVTP